MSIHPDHSQKASEAIKQAVEEGGVIKLPLSHLTFSGSPYLEGFSQALNGDELTIVEEVSGSMIFSFSSIERFSAASD